MVMVGRPAEVKTNLRRRKRRWISRLEERKYGKTGVEKIIAEIREMREEMERLKKQPVEERRVKEEERKSG